MGQHSAPQGEAAYVAAVRASRRAFDDIERVLATLADGSTVDARRVRSALGMWLPDEAVLLVCLRLEQLGALVNAREGWRLSFEGLEQTAGFRRGVRVAIDQAEKPGEALRLVSALPGGLDERLVEALRRDTTDLLAALIDLIAGAREALILASPFWDDETIRGIEPILSRRLNAGVHVDILARSASAISELGRPIAQLQQRLGAYERLRVYTWFEMDASDPWGSRTFHFKAACVDKGRRSYLGTANFTSSGLRSRFELGVILAGDQSAALFRVLELVLRVCEVQQRP